MSETQTQDTVFAIQTEAFAGPLELLLELIEKRKFLINDISLASVTDDYIQHVAELQRSSYKSTAQFVMLASTLLLIKSRSLLPVLELTQEEEGSIEDLQDRLRLYQIYRDAGKLLTESFGRMISYGRTYRQDTTPVFTPDQYTQTEALHDAIARVLTELPKEDVKPRVQVKKTVSLEEMMDRLHERALRQMRFGFRDFTGNNTERHTVIVGFLAVLEMVKQGRVLVQQTGRFEDIAIEREVSGVPRYQ